MGKIHEIMLGITSHQVNANKNHSEASDPQLNGFHAGIKKVINAGRDVRTNVS